MTVSFVTLRSEKAKCSFFRVSLDSSLHVFMLNTPIANIPHNPVRFAGTVGVVIERVRPHSSLGTPDAGCLLAQILILFVH